MFKTDAIIRHKTSGRKAEVVRDQLDHMVYICWLEDDGKDELSFTTEQACEFEHVPLPTLKLPDVFECNISQHNLQLLEDTFAALTENGWVIPDWLKLLRMKFPPVNNIEY